MRVVRAAASPAGVALVALAGVGLVLRLVNNDYGLPYVYNIDEGSHFTNRAVEMFGGDPNPGYFQNPSGYTYLVHLALRFQFGHGWPFADFSRVPEQYRADPTGIYDTARSLAAVLCIVGVVAAFWAARALWGDLEGVAAAGILSFAFLPVAYSRIAATDVGTLAPVAVALVGAVRILDGGGRGAYALAGAGAGLAVGFKYTAGLVLLPVALATGARLVREGAGALGGAALALGAALLALFLTTPFLFLDADTALRQLAQQAETAGAFPKLGQEHDSGALYYLDSLRWGLGWGAGAAAVGGLVVVARRDRLRALVLVAFPLALFLYLALQSRYFGRWLLPAYPALALLAAAGIGALVRRVSVRPWVRAGALALALLVVLAQPAAADARTARALGREDTRAIAREFLVHRYRPRLRIVIEPAVPARYYRLTRPRREFAPSRKQFVRGFARDVRESRLDYAATLRPRTIDRYRRNGYCLVMTMSVIRGRAEAAGLPPALAYYERLDRESRVVYRGEPYAPGKGPVPFHFDLSYNLYPRAFERPGPEVTIHRLDDCEQGYGPLPPGRGRPRGAEGRRS
jgi:hypothetical protein